MKKILNIFLFMTICIFAGAQDGDDRRIVERGERAGLALKAAGATGAVGRPHDLERHFA